MATDHAPHAVHEKEVPFEQAPMGTTGLETAFAALFTELVLTGELELETVIERMTAGGALYGLAVPRIETGRAGQPVPGRPRGALRGRCRWLRQPLGQLLLPRAPAPGQGAADGGGGDGGARDPNAGRGPGGSVSQPTAYVLLEDGARFDGLACGAEVPAVGEIVFTTSMSGYQEAMTDPSYAGQLLTFTYPQIGNYGVSSQAMESDRVHARAAIMRAAVDHHDALRAEQGWLAWLRAERHPGHHRPRHPRAGPPHPRPGRDARRRVSRPRSPRPTPAN